MDIRAWLIKKKPVAAESSVITPTPVQAAESLTHCDAQLRISDSDPPTATPTQRDIVKRLRQDTIQRLTMDVAQMVRVRLNDEGYMGDVVFVFIRGFRAV